MCRELASTVFKHNEKGDFSYVARQPETAEELAQAREAVSRCPQKAIHDDGLQFDWDMVSSVDTPKPPGATRRWSLHFHCKADPYLYDCGVRAGQRVRLKKTKSHGVGDEIWQVVRGVDSRPRRIVALRKPDGSPYLWTGKKFWDWFELLP